MRTEEASQRCQDRDSPASTSRHDNGNIHRNNGAVRNTTAGSTVYSHTVLEGRKHGNAFMGMNGDKMRKDTNTTAITATHTYSEARNGIDTSDAEHENDHDGAGDGLDTGSSLHTEIFSLDIESRQADEPAGGGDNNMGMGSKVELLCSDQTEQDHTGRNDGGSRQVSALRTSVSPSMGSTPDTKPLLYSAIGSLEEFTADSFGKRNAQHKLLKRKGFCKMQSSHQGQLIAPPGFPTVSSVAQTNGTSKARTMSSMTKPGDARRVSTTTITLRPLQKSSSGSLNALLSESQVQSEGEPQNDGNTTKPNDGYNQEEKKDDAASPLVYIKKVPTTSFSSSSSSTTAAGETTVTATPAAKEPVSSSSFNSRPEQTTEPIPVDPALQELQDSDRQVQYTAFLSSSLTSKEKKKKTSRRKSKRVSIKDNGHAGMRTSTSSDAINAMGTNLVEPSKSKKRSTMKPKRKEMFRPSCDAYTPRMEPKSIKYKPAEARTPVQSISAPMGTLSKPNFRDALRRVSMILHQHIAKIERRFGSNTDLRDGLFRSSMRETFSEERFSTPRYKCAMVRIPMARAGMVYGMRKIKERPAIPTEEEIYEFAHRLFKKVQLSSECSIVCLIYVERLMEMARVPLLATTWRPVVMGGLLMASKVWQDLSSWNVEFSVVYPQFSLEAINKLELEILKLLKWDLYISGSLYAKYYFALRALLGKPDFRQRYNRMVGGVGSVNAMEALNVQKRTEELKEQVTAVYLSKSM